MQVVSLRREDAQLRLHIGVRRYQAVLILLRHGCGTSAAREPSYRDWSGRWWTASGDAADAPGIWARDEPLAIPGGADALARWDAEDDDACERFVERHTLAIHAEDIAKGCD